MSDRGVGGEVAIPDGVLLNASRDGIPRDGISLNGASPGGEASNGVSMNGEAGHVLVPDSRFDSRADAGSGDAAGGGYGYAAEDTGTVPVPPSGMAIARRALRGRYRWALAIGGVLGAAGATAAALLVKPVYRSAGLIDVAPKVPRVLYESDEKGLLPMFDAYVASEASRASTRRVADLAMASPAWKALGRGTSDEAVAQFQESLDVTHPKYTQLVQIAFTDADPDAAMIAVNETIDAYMKIVREREELSDASTRRVLETQRTLGNARLGELRASVLVVTEELGELSLETRYRSGIDELNQLDLALHALDMEAVAAAGAAGGAAGASREISEQEISLRDSVMERLVTERNEARAAVTLLVTDQKLGERHPDLVAARRALTAAELRASQRAAAFRDSALASSVVRPESPAERAARRVRLVGLRAAVEEETRRLGKRRVQLGNIEQERRLQTESLEDVKRRLEQIDVEAGVHGRISVASHGDRPVQAESDRRIPLALLGGLGGLALGFAAVAFRGVREGRLRYVTDVEGEASMGRFLGVVPDLASAADAPASGDGLGGGLAGGLADFCIHHIRTMLQVRSGGRRTVVALTSPSAGAGKTMLTIALGRSFAATGARTLVVDCDFIGHGLSTAMRGIVCEDAARVLAPERDASPASEVINGVAASFAAGPRAFADSSRVAWLLDEAEARRDGGEAGLGGTIRSLGLVSDARDGEAQDPRPRGVLGVLHGRPVRDCVVGTGWRGLEALTVGEPGQRSAERLSQASVARLLAVCRASYDVVLVDTGPVLGSLEAVFAAVAADGVIVVVPRGDRRPAVEQTLARLELLGAPVAGVVFNRATVADVAASSYASRSASRPAVA